MTTAAASSPRAAKRGTIVPSGKACGAEVRDVDLRGLDGGSVDALREALARHLVVRVRRQPLTDPQLIALGKSLGELEPPGMSIIGKP